MAWSVNDDKPKTTAIDDVDIDVEAVEADIAKQRLRPWQLALVLLTLAVSMASMGSTIVLESHYFPENQWLLILM